MGVASLTGISAQVADTAGLTFEPDPALLELLLARLTHNSAPCVVQTVLVTLWCFISLFILWILLMKLIALAES